MFVFDEVETPLLAARVKEPGILPEHAGYLRQTSKVVERCLRNRWHNSPACCPPEPALVPAKRLLSRVASPSARPKLVPSAARPAAAGFRFPRGPSARNLRRRGRSRCRD